MAVFELETYDILTAEPERAYALLSFWSNLSSLGARSARLLILTDHLNFENARRGFDRVAVPFADLPRDVRWYRSYYEQHLADTIRETQFIRVFFICRSSVGERTLRQLIEGYGIGTRSLDPDGVPLPLATATKRWDRAIDERGRHWAVLQSAVSQTGAVTPHMLHRLFRQEFPCYVAIDIFNYLRTEASQMLRTKAAVAAVSLARVRARESAIEAGDTQLTIDEMRRDIGTLGVGLHQIRVAVAVWGDTPQELNERLELAKGASAIDLQKRPARIGVLGEMFAARPPEGRSGSLVTSTHVAVLGSSAVSAARPTHTEGVLIGFDPGQSPVVINLFDRRNSAYNAVVVGQTGAGKSFFSLLLMVRSLLTGVRLIIIDPKGDIDLSWLGRDDRGRELCRTIPVGTSQSAINILEPIFPEKNNQIEFVINGLAMLGVFNPRNALERTLIDLALGQVYAGIEWERIGQPSEAVPLLADLMAQILTVGAEQGGEIQEAARRIHFQLIPFACGSRAALFGRPTNVDFSLSAPVTVFDVSSFPSRQSGEGMRAMLFAILFGMINQSILNRRRRGDRAPIQFFVDEIGVLMRDAVVADYVSDKYKTARSLGVSMIVADQTIASLIGPADAHGVHHGDEMLANAPHRFIFFQQGSEKEMTEKTFPMMPPTYRRQIHALPRGQCVAQTPQGTFRVIVSPSELEQIVFSSALHDRDRAQALIAQMRRELAEM